MSSQPTNSGSARQELPFELLTGEAVNAAHDSSAMQAWARELQIGAWFELDYRGKQESVQLAWSGLRQQLLLFVTPSGRGILFQLHRLAAFLQAGLLVPQEEESLTTRATRAFGTKKSWPAKSTPASTTHFLKVNDSPRVTAF